MTRAFVVHRPDSGEVVHVHLHPSDLEIEVDEILTIRLTTLTSRWSRSQPLTLLNIEADGVDDSRGNP